jgi:magnesium transporter
LGLTVFNEHCQLYTMITLHGLRAGKPVELSVAEIPKFIFHKTNTLWADFNNPTEAEYRLLSDKFMFHPLAIEDCVYAKVRPKMEDYEDYLFFVFPSPSNAPGARALQTVNLNVFLGRNYIVTVHSKPLKSVESVTQLMKKDTSLLSRGPDRILHNLLDELIDLYFPSLEKIEATLDSIEANIFKEFTGHTLLQKISQTRRHVRGIGRKLSPTRDVLKILSSKEVPYISKKTRFYFRDVHEHSMRLLDYMETYREVLSQLVESYMSQVSNRMNEVMKTLSIIATIMLPLGVISGIYGTNFANLPGATNYMGFWIMIIFMLILSIILVIYFKRKHWM